MSPVEPAVPVIVALLTARFTAPSTNIVEANETLSLNVEIPVTSIPAPSVVIPISLIPVILPLLSTVILADLSKSTQQCHKIWTFVTTGNRDWILQNQATNGLFCQG